MFRMLAAWKWMTSSGAAHSHIQEGYEPRILSHDFRFYHTLNMKLNYAVNQDEIKKYFPLHRVTQGMFCVYEELLSLKFRELKGDECPPLWHDEVQAFEVVSTDSGDVIGFFFLDLFPR